MNSIRKSHRQHDGELHVQSRRRVPLQVSASLARVIHDEMPRPLVDYYRGLPLLPLGVTDASGRPWATILCNPRTSAPTGELLMVRARVNPDDPFVSALRAHGSDPRHFAGVAIDFASRSRVKLAGVVDAATLDEDAVLTLALRANEHMGNCPKYITVRDLRQTHRSPETTALGKTLSAAARDVLERASTSFVATRHRDQDPRESDMGMNHRGGPPGFLRYFEDEQGAFLVLPDYSGNRFYQSLGNVETDPVMGVAVPDFTSGALLQVSGRAKNLYDDEASRVMPGTSLITLVSIDEAFLTLGALDLELASPEQLSPYNPPVRPLVGELPPDRTGLDMAATLVDITVESSRISTFTFALSAPVDPVELAPGGYAVFDFAGQLARLYQHMNDTDPLSLNDDLVRTFTVSRISPDRRQISITVKKSGVVSSYLHGLSMGRGQPPSLRLKGVGRTFTCMEDGRALPHMVWVAGGVGITPFLAMYRALRDSGQPMPEIELLYACRGDEVALVSELTDVKVRIFNASAPPLEATSEHAQLERRRLRASDFRDQALLDRATVFVCGPDGFMADVTSWLEPRVSPGRLRVERFTY